MGLAMSYTSKTQHQQKSNCPLFEKERIEIYETSKYKDDAAKRNGNKDTKSPRIQILECCAFVEDQVTTIEERRDVLRYVTPQFRAWAKVRVPPLSRDETWQIGWIQACSSMKFVNTYGDEGCTSWEFQELDTGLYPMISDSDGRASPWYGTAKHNVRTVLGPTSDPIDLTLTMQDNFYPSVTWSIPLPSKHLLTELDDAWDRQPRLSHITRDQAFYTWLVARNLTNQVWYVLKTARWRANIEISVNPKMPLGRRATLFSQKMSQGPLILPYNVTIPRCVLFPPNANSAQILVWRSSSKADGRTYLVVPPKSTAVKYKVQRRLGMAVVIKPQVSQCQHGKLTLHGEKCDNNMENDIIAEIEAYLNMESKTTKMEKVLA